MLTAEGTVHSAATTNARCNPVIDEDPGKAQAALRNELVIPAAQTTPEAVLQWPILASEFPSSYMIDAVFEAEIEETDSTEEDESENQRSRSFSRSRATCFCEDDVMDLVQRFLDLVHIKNPVLEPETIWSYARRVVEDGLKWDSVSCLVVSPSLAVAHLVASSSLQFHSSSRVHLAAWHRSSRAAALGLTLARVALSKNMPSISSVERHTTTWPAEGWVSSRKDCLPLKATSWRACT